MPDDIRYPVYTGAVQGGNLVIACGTYNTPAAGEPVEVRGFIYEVPPTGANPPAGAALGTTGTGNRWEIIGVAGPPCLFGSVYWLRVWVRSMNGGGWGVVGDVSFTACDPDGPNCEIDCGYSEEQVVVAGYQHTVIETIATRVFAMRPSPAILELLSAFHEKPVDLPQIEIAFQPGASTQDRAVWMGEGYRGAQYRLEVTRKACGRMVAVLQEFRLTDSHVQTLLRWQSDDFSVVHGGELRAVEGEQHWREGGVALAPLIPQEEGSAEASNNHQQAALRARRRVGGSKRGRRR